LPVLSPEFVGSHINRIDVNAAQLFYGTDIFELWHTDAFTDYYYANCDKNIDFYSGIKNGLLEFKRLGFDLGVATNGATKFAEKILNTLGADNLFSMILGADSVQNPKPHPDMLHKIIDFVKKDKLVLVGDSVKDQQAAWQAGGKFAFAAYGFGPYDVASDLRLDSSEDIGKIINLL
jgi:phosphoglycolate phosphatase